VGLVEKTLPLKLQKPGNRNDGEIPLRTPETAIMNRIIHSSKNRFAIMNLTKFEKGRLKGTTNLILLRIDTQ
jgi:hypothetical protein